MMLTPLIQTQALTIGYHDKHQQRRVQEALTLQVYRGEMVGLIGPNGCGKSTLLRTLLGLQPALEGQIYIDQAPLEQQSLAKRARLVAAVLTDPIEIEHFTVKEMVALGRNPYTNWLGKLSVQDQLRVDEALQQVHMESYAQRPISSLSDGEKQRVLIAKALVQDTPAILLDEPTAHLDLPNRVDIMILLQQLARETHKAIIISTHELDLAIQTSDKLWLMTPQKGVAVGTPEDLILSQRLQKVFENPRYVFDNEMGGFMLEHHLQYDIALESSAQGAAYLWTQRALARAGYRIVPQAALRIKVNESPLSWHLCTESDEVVCNNIEKLLEQLHKKANPI